MILWNSFTLKKLGLLGIFLILLFYTVALTISFSDAYLCVANMSIPIANPEEVAVCAALKMISAVRNMKKNLNLRVGVASGPLIGNFYFF